MGCDGLAWLLLRCFLLIPLFLRCVMSNSKFKRGLHADSKLSLSLGYRVRSGWNWFKASCKSSSWLIWYRSVLLTYLCPAMYWVVLRSLVLSHRLITLCRICWALVSFGFSFLRP